MLRVVSAQEGIDYEGDLGPVIEGADDFSQPLGEVRTEGLPASRGMEHEVCADAVAPDHFVTGRIDQLVEESVATGACDTREAAREAWAGASRRVGPRRRACS